MKNSNGKPVLSKEEKAERWKEYIEGFYKENALRDNIVGREEEVDADELGDTILRDEFDRALKELTRRNAPGVDNVPAELLKSLGEPAMTKLFHLVRKMYETGEIPSDIKKKLIIPIPNKDDAGRCENYKAKSLISHGCKILTPIVYRWVEKLIEADLEKDQFGFRRNVGTREAILTLRLFLQDRLRKGELSFEDLEKALSMLFGILSLKF